MTHIITVPASELPPRAATRLSKKSGKKKTLKKKKNSKKNKRKPVKKEIVNKKKKSNKKKSAKKTKKKVVKKTHRTQAPAPTPAQPSLPEEQPQPPLARTAATPVVESRIDWDKKLEELEKKHAAQRKIEQEHIAKLLDEKVKKIKQEAEEHAEHTQNLWNRVIEDQKKWEEHARNYATEQKTKLTKQLEDRKKNIQATEQVHLVTLRKPSQDAAQKLPPKNRIALNNDLIDATAQENATVESIKARVIAGADVTFHNENGFSALSMATMAGNKPVVTYLHDEAGARLTPQDNAIIANNLKQLFEQVQSTLHHKDDRQAFINLGTHVEMFEFLRKRVGFAEHLKRVSQVAKAMMDAQLGQQFVGAFSQEPE